MDCVPALYRQGNILTINVNKKVSTPLGILNKNAFKYNLNMFLKTLNKSNFIYYSEYYNIWIKKFVSIPLKIRLNLIENFMSLQMVCSLF
jgi:hypothetical protein